MKYMMAEEAQTLMYAYTQKLFKDRAENLETVYLDPSLIKEARKVILALSDNLDAGIDHLSIELQRYLYECFIEAIMFFSSLTPDAQSPEVIQESMRDDEKLSSLLRNGIAEMELPFPVRGIH